MQNKIEDIIQDLKEYLSEDCSYYSGKIFGSMSSYPDEDARRIFSEFMEKNAGDANIFAGTNRMEKRVVEMIGNYFRCYNAEGNIVSGGSEANIVGLWAARNYFRSKNKNQTKKLELIAPVSRHTSIAKAADLLDFKLIEVPLNEYYEVDVKQVEEKITEQTIGLVGIAGSTVYGAIDDIERLSEIALNNNIWLHVDAAFGGFIIKCLGLDMQFDFRNDGVLSMVVDPHKMLGSPIPAGCIIFRDEIFSDNIIHHLPYFSGERTENRTIVGTKPGASIIATYFLLKYKSYEGQEQRVHSSITNSTYLKEELTKRDFEIKGKVQLNVIAAKPPENLEEKRASLFKKGWRIGKFKDLWRFVVMPNIQKTDIDLLLEELDMK